MTSWEIQPLSLTLVLYRAARLSFRKKTWTDQYFERNLGTESMTIFGRSLCPICLPDIPFITQNTWPVTHGTQSKNAGSCH